MQGNESTRSGDNAALIALLEKRGGAEVQKHLHLAPQCTMNSYLWRTSPLQIWRWLRNPLFVKQGLWQPGDFILHLAGFSDKFTALQRLNGHWRKDTAVST